MQANAWAGAGSSPTPGSLVSRRVGSGKRRRFRDARAEAPEVRGGRGLLREPVPRVEGAAERFRARPRRRDLFVLESEKRVRAHQGRGRARQGGPGRARGFARGHGAEDAHGRQGRHGRARARAARDGVAGHCRRDATTLETGTCCAQWSTDGDAPEGVPSGPRTAARPRASRASCPGSTRSRTATSARCCGSDARRTSGGAIRGARRGLAGFDSPGVGGRSLCDAK